MERNKIFCVPALNLPQNMPTKKAIRSDVQYLPEMWELEYAGYEYLASHSDASLYERHKALTKNMMALTSPDRDIVPIESFLSSWYWFRKEHQTRCEIAKRNLPAPDAVKDIPLEFPTNNQTHIRPTSPNACNVLYRFTEPKYAEALLMRGSLYLKCASEMEKHEGHNARYDIETKKSRYTLGKHTKILTEDGKALPIIGDVTHTRSLPDYYLYCVSADYDRALLHEFGGACVIIKDPQEFSRRLQAWGRKQLVGWEFYDLPVEYYDPYEPIKDQRIDTGFSKRIEFAYQREFRFIFFNPDGTAATALSPIEIGSIEDIAEIMIERK